MVSIPGTFKPENLLILSLGGLYEDQLIDFSIHREFNDIERYNLVRLDQRQVTGWYDVSFGMLIRQVVTNDSNRYFLSSCMASLLLIDCLHALYMVW